MRCWLLLVHGRSAECVCPFVWGASALLLLLWFAVCQTCLILLGGFVFFPPAIPLPTETLLKNVGGIIVALVGVVVYSQLKIAESSPTSQPDWVRRHVARLVPQLGREAVRDRGGG